MLIQEYSEVFPFVRVLRRLLAEGVPIDDMQAKIDSLKASGDLKLPNPREQLPRKWWLVELPIDTPHGRKLSIETGDVWNPIDPIGISCCERLVPPIVMYAPGESRVPAPVDSTAVKQQRESAIAEWLRDKTMPNPKGKQVLSADPKVYWDECAKKFLGATHGELKRALLVARERLGLVKPRSRLER